MADVAEERKFIHDLASPLSSLQLDLENVAAVLEDAKPDDIELAKKMAATCLKQVQKMAELLRQRRATLMQESGQK